MAICFWQNKIVFSLFYPGDLSQTHFPVLVLPTASTPDAQGTAMLFTISLLVLLLLLHEYKCYTQDLLTIPAC